MKEPGVDIILDPTGELDQRLTSALLRSRLTHMADLAPVTSSETKHQIRKLCSLWNLAIMLHGMTQVGQPAHAWFKLNAPSALSAYDGGDCCIRNRQKQKSHKR